MSVFRFTRSGTQRWTILLATRDLPVCQHNAFFLSEENAGTINVSYVHAVLKYYGLLLQY